MPDKQEHQQEVHGFLQKHFSIADWSFSLPHGSGMETYFVQGNGRDYFVKVGAPVERYLAMAEIDLTPPVSIYGQLESGLSIMVQPFITGRKPTRADYRGQLDKVAALIRKMHHHSQLKELLQTKPSNLYKDAGIQALDRLRQRWELYKAQVPTVAEFVDDGLEYLARQINTFTGAGTRGVTWRYLQRELAFYF